MRHFQHINYPDWRPATDDADADLSSDEYDDEEEEEEEEAEYYDEEDPFEEGNLQYHES